MSTHLDINRKPQWDQDKQVQRSQQFGKKVRNHQMRMFLSGLPDQNGLPHPPPPPLTRKVKYFDAKKRELVETDMYIPNTKYTRITNRSRKR